MDFAGETGGKQIRGKERERFIESDLYAGGRGQNGKRKFQPEHARLLPRRIGKRNVELSRRMPHGDAEFVGQRLREFFGGHFVPGKRSDAALVGLEVGFEIRHGGKRRRNRAREFQQNLRALLPSGFLFVVDGAQGAGHLPLPMKTLGIDALALAGHKGLGAVQGAGALLFSERFAPKPVLYGGTGSESSNLNTPV